MSTFTIILVVLDLVLQLEQCCPYYLWTQRAQALELFLAGQSVFHNRTAKDILLERLATIFSILFVLTTIFMNVFKVF